MLNKNKSIDTKINKSKNLIEIFYYVFVLYDIPELMITVEKVISIDPSKKNHETITNQDCTIPLSIIKGTHIKRVPFESAK